MSIIQTAEKSRLCTVFLHSSVEHDYLLAEMRSFSAVDGCSDEALEQEWAAGAGEC